MNRWRNEEGATLVIVAVSLFALFGVTMLAVDGGSLFTTRRSLVTDTDAAALAAALKLNEASTSECLAAAAGGSSEAEAEADAVLAANDARVTGNKEFVVATTSPTCQWATVRVGAEVEGPLFFAPLFGFQDINVYSSSTALVGPLSRARGLRPIGICKDNKHIVEWVAAGQDPDNPVYKALAGTDDGDALGDMDSSLYDHPTRTATASEKYNTSVDYLSGTVVHRIPFEKHPTDCGSAPGNWDWLCFVGNCGASDRPGDLGYMLDEGFDGTVDLGGPGQGDEDCDDTTSGTSEDCTSKTGANASAKDNLDDLVCDHSLPASDPSCVQFPVLVYSDMSGSGTNAVYEPYAFLGVVLRDHAKVIGCNPNNPSSCGWFDFEFVDLIWEGRVGGAAAGSPTLRGVELCGTNLGDAVDENCDI